MKGLVRKLKEWATDCPAEPHMTLAEVIMHKGPTLSIAAQVLRDGLPFHVRWMSEGIRDDN